MFTQLAADLLQGQVEFSWLMEGFFSCENILCNQGRAVNLGAAGVVTIFYRHL